MRLRRFHAYWFLSLTLSVVMTALLGFVPSTAAGQSADSHGFVDRVHRDAAGEHKYVVFVPENYSADTKWPVILYLHGAGERGSDGRLHPFATPGANYLPGPFAGKKRTLDG